MKRLGITVTILLAGAVPAAAQSIGNQDIQIHGFATQSFVASNNNNYLGMDTRSFSPSWTEAAININDEITDKLRVGIQLHYTREGNFGGDNASIDWALGDYKFNQYLGLRAGKVKMRWGLFNDTQDYDPGYLWSLLPSPSMGSTIALQISREMVSRYYGRLPLGLRLGKLVYSGYFGGGYYVASDDGYMESAPGDGLHIRLSTGRQTPGFDLRWQTRRGV